MNDATTSPGAECLRVLRLRSLTFALALSIGGLSRSADAAPLRVSVLSHTDCPAATEVAAQLRRSLTEATVVVYPAPATEVVTIVDGGEHYTIAANGEERSIEDTERDCDERARVAAVFAAMILDPPVIGEQGVAAPPQAATSNGDSLPEETSLRDHAAPRNASAWLSFGVLTSWAGASDQPLAVGPEVGLGVAHGALELRSLIAVTTPTTLRFGDARAELVRFPASVSAYIRSQHSAVEGAVGVGLAVEGLHIAGRGNFTPHTHGIVQVGGRAAARARLLFDAGWSVFCELTGTFVPSTHELAIEPDGVVGSTPAVWLGLTLGGTMGLLL